MASVQFGENGNNLKVTHFVPGALIMAYTMMLKSYQQTNIMELVITATLNSNMKNKKIYQAS